MNDKFKEALEKAIRHYGSQNRLAHRSGVSVMTISRIRRGEQQWISEPVKQRLMRCLSDWYTADEDTEYIVRSPQVKKLLDYYEKLNHKRRRELLNTARDLAADQLID